MDQPNSPAWPRRHGPRGPHSAIHRHKDAPSGHQDFQACTSSQTLLKSMSQNGFFHFLPDFIHHTDHTPIYIYLNKCVLMYFGRFGSKSIILSCNQDRYGTIKTDCSSTSQLHGHQAWHHRKSAPHSPPWQSKATYETGKAGSVTHRIIPSNSKWLHVIPSYSMLFSQWNMDKRGTSCVTSDPSP